MKKVTLALMGLFAVTVLLFAGFAKAEVVAPQTLTAGPGERRTVSGSETAEAQAGNVSSLNIHAIAITTSWQGYYGNITGTITLDDAENNTFYNWSVATPQGEVFASRAASPGWTTINCTNTTEIAAEETYLGQVAADADSVSNTYTSTSHPTFDVSTQADIDSCNSTNAFTSTGQDNSRFHQVLLADDSSNIVYATIIDADQTGFNGATADFELLVGENGKAGNEGATTYYFFVELD